MTTPQAVVAARSFAAGAACLAKTGRHAERTMWAALRYFADATPSASTVKTFAAQHGISETVSSSEIQKLVSLGFVAKESSSTDQRSKIFRLSAKGKALLKQDPFLLLAQALEEQFSPAELRTVGLAIGKLAFRANEWATGAAEGHNVVIGRLEEELSPEDDETPASARNAARPGRKARADASQQALSVVRALALIAGTVVKAGNTEELAYQEWSALRYFPTAPAENATVGGYADHHALSANASSLTIAALKEKGLLANKLKKDGTPSRQVAITREGLALLRRDPNLKIAKVFDSEFSVKQLSVIAGAMTALLTQAPQIERPILSRLPRK